MDASSYVTNGHRPRFGRLNYNGAWCSQSSNGNQEWLEIELQETTEICGVATQGRETDDAYVIDFKLSYSPDGSGWTTYTDSEGSGMVRQGISIFNVIKFRISL